MVDPITFTPAPLWKKALACIPVVAQCLPEFPGFAAAVALLNDLKFLQDRVQEKRPFEFELSQQAKQDPNLQLQLIHEFQVLTNCIAVQGVIVVIAAVALYLFSCIGAFWATVLGIYGAVTIFGSSISQIMAHNYLRDNLALAAM